jgi:hypothetical protein
MILFGWWDFVQFYPKPDLFYGFFIFEIHIHPIIQPILVELSGFNRFNRICPIYIHPKIYIKMQGRTYIWWYTMAKAEVKF